MRIGIMLDSGDGSARKLDDIIALAQKIEQLGIDNAWLSHIFSFDSITTLALIGRETTRLGLGTAVTPSYPRHPTAMAQQAMTAAAACEGRFTLGIGLSHQIVIENMLGLSYARTASHMEEYLQVLMPAIRGEQISFDGEEFRVHAQFNVPGSEAPPVVVAALGPRMLNITGRLADGTTTWMTGPKTLRDHIIPNLRQAAQAAGRAEPRVVCGLPIVLTDDKAEARRHIDKLMAIYPTLPSYQAMLQREGAGSAADIALIGNSSELQQQLAELRKIGVSDFNALVAAPKASDFDKTLEFLAGQVEQT